MAFETIDYQVSDYVATVTLNRPRRLNAINDKLESELFEALTAADQSEEVRVIILTGAGKGFCAGADLSKLTEVTEMDWSQVSPAEALRRIVPPRPNKDVREDFQKAYSYFPALTKPVLGAINGAAVGLGFVLPLYCDIRWAAEGARFGTAFAQRGLIAEHGVSWLLPRLVGLSHAFDLLYSARLIDASEALRIGLVSRVVAADKLLEEMRDYAKQLATTVSPRSLRIIKRQLYDAQFQSLGEATDAANEEMIAAFQCEDFKEGVSHFLEKRPANFVGR